MSGGEQQMLAIARALMARPRRVLLDEPSEGIMPILVDEMFDLFVRLKQQGTTILLVEQKVERALKISERACILDQGQIVHQGDAQALLAGPRDSGQVLRGVSGVSGVATAEWQTRQRHTHQRHTHQRQAGGFGHVHHGGECRAVVAWAVAAMPFWPAPRRRCFDRKVGVQTTPRIRRKKPTVRRSLASWFD